MNEIKINLLDFSCSLIKVRDKLHMSLSNDRRVFNFLVPDGVLLKLNSNLLNVQSIQGFEKVSLRFSNNIKLVISSPDKIYRLSFFLAGVGFRGFFTDEGTYLCLKLGFTNIVRCRIPDSIIVKLTKKSLVLESANAVVLGNFGNFLVNLRPANSYKLKGIIPKNFPVRLKVVKKK